MTARGATSGSPFFDDYRVEASTGNAASPSTMFLQLGNWISAPAYRTFGIRRRMSSGSATAFSILLQQVGQFRDVRGDPPRFIARQPVREAATHGLVFEIHVSQRPAVCIFDNEAFAVLDNTPGRGPRISHDSSNQNDTQCADYSERNEKGRRAVTGKNGPPAPTGIVTILRLPHNGRDLIPNEPAGTWPSSTVHDRQPMCRMKGA